MGPIRPTSDRLLVKIIEETEVQSGIEVVRIKRNPRQLGLVLSTGPGTKDRPMPEDLEGKVVRFISMANVKEFEWEGEKLAMIRLDNVLVIHQPVEA
jgi:co-chaperonin GroES (HSP10)